MKCKARLVSRLDPKYSRCCVQDQHDGNYIHSAPMLTWLDSSLGAVSHDEVVYSEYLQWLKYREQLREM